MRSRTLAAVIMLIFSALTVTYAQRRWGRGLPIDEEDNPVPMPADAAEKTEYAFGRLKYPSLRGGPGGIWAMRGSWYIDYPKADRTFVQGLRRLSRVHTRSVEQVVSMDEDDPAKAMFNWPSAIVTGRPIIKGVFAPA